MRSGQYPPGRHGSRALLITTIVIALALAGCNANPEPAPLPTEGVTSSATTTPSASPTPPAMPAEAEGTNKAAAKAFVRHYIDLINHATTTGDTAPLALKSDGGCASCQAVIERVDHVYSAGGHIESDGWQIRSLTAVPLQARHRPVVEAGLLLSPQDVVKGAGDGVDRFEGGRLLATFYLEFRGNDWIVVRWERAA